MRRAYRQLGADGAGRIGLEVAVDNDRALTLYTFVGFARNHGGLLRAPLELIPPERAHNLPSASGLVYDRQRTSGVR